MKENLKPTRLDILKDKFLGIESWAHKGERFACDSQQMKDCFYMIKKLVHELDVLVNTTEEAGRKIGWWA